MARKGIDLCEQYNLLTVMNATTNTAYNRHIRYHRRVAKIQNDRQKARNEVLRLVSLIAFVIAALCACSFWSTWK